MTKRSLLFASLGIALLTAGCENGTANRGLESVHQPIVSRADYVLDLAMSGGALAPGERQRLAGWMSTMRLSYGDRVAIDGVYGRSGYARDEVAGEAGRYGLLLDEGAPVTSAPVTPGTLRVVVSRMRADVPGCPDWSRKLNHDHENHTFSNYGCSVNSILAAMVASPADLVRGQATDEPTDPAIATRAIDAFRKAAPSGAGGTAVKGAN